MRPYRDRREAGELLGMALLRHLGEDPRPSPIVLALPRGGVLVGAAAATLLAAPLDVLPVRKLGVPGSPELAMGALAVLDGTGGRASEYLDEAMTRRLGLTPADVEQVRAAGLRELLRRAAAYRTGRAAVSLVGVRPVLVDDGLATGATMRAALRAVAAAGGAGPVVAVPVGSPAALAELGAGGIDVVCPLAPPSFTAVGAWYERFPQVSDAEVERLLGAAVTPPAG